MKDVSV